MIDGVPKFRYDHHRRTMEVALKRICLEDDVRLVLLGGSIAKGIEREESDVDFIVVVTDEGYRERLKTNRVSFYYDDVADYPGGYAEGRFISRSFVFAAAENGSEPTRSSFTGVTPVWGEDPEIVRAIQSIPLYPVREREHRLDSFYAQLMLFRGYFWPEGIRRGDAYLTNYSATQIVLFGGRFILVHRQILFPNQKRLMETLEKTDPEIAELAREFLAKNDKISLERFYESVVKVGGERKIDLASRFTEDSEMSWFTPTHWIGDW